jgi:glycosyltransferase involved in cell wall biosynthesis
MKYFASKGHEMHLISFVDVSAERSGELQRNGITYHGSTGNLHLKRFWHTLNDLRFVRSVLKAQRIDVLHSHFLGTNTWYAALSGFHPHIITIMGGDVIGQDWRPSRSVQERLLTPYALRSADALTAWSSSLADRVRPYVRAGVEIATIHGGVELERFRERPASDLREQLRIPEKSRVVFSPRLIRELYNIHIIAEAAGLVCRQLPDVFFVLALPETILDEDYVARVRAIFAGNAAGENVRFVPGIGHDKISDYFHLADATVSIPGTDGTPASVLESMACGTPTVIGDLPDYDKEYFEHEKTAVMVDVRDAGSVASAIIRILTNPDEAADMAFEARRRVFKTGGYEYQMEKMEKIYRRVNGE